MARLSITSSYRFDTGIVIWRLPTIDKIINFLVAGTGFEPATFGL